MSLSLQKAAFDMILAHLVKVEDEKEYVLDMCFPKPDEERERMRASLDRYLLRMNELIGKLKVDEKPVDGSAGSEGTRAGIALPFVIVGSEVSVVDLKSGEKLNYRVQHPFKTSGSGDEISYISPLGAALLLKKPGQEISVEIPAGKLHYRVESVRLAGEPAQSLAQ